MPFLTLNTIESKLSILDVSSSERSAARLAFNARFASSHLYPKGVFTRDFSATATARLDGAELDLRTLLLLLDVPYEDLDEAGGG